VLFASNELQNLYSLRERIWQDRALNLCNGAGDGDRTRISSLGSCLSALYLQQLKIAKQNAPCIPCSPCQSSRSCILWWDIGGTKPSHVDLSVNNLTTAPAQVKMLEMDWFVHARSKFLSMDFR